VLLETKASHEIFEEYDAHLMLIKLCVWRDEIESLDEGYLKPFKIFLRDDRTVS
jgi:ubiquitin carboxyl-terminal hydrolase 47